MRRTGESASQRYVEPAVSPFKATQRLGPLEAWLEYSDSLFWRNQHVNFNSSSE